MHKKYITKSGLRVVLAPRQGTETVTVCVLCSAGSRHEIKTNNGISHFVEHLMFKGTAKRPTTLDISKELDGVGAVFNAYTSKDHTNYHIKVASNHIEKAFDILSDMLQNSKFDTNEIEREKGVIFEEMKMYEDNPMYYIEDLFENLVFEGHELGRHIIGTRDVITNISRKMILNYINNLYQPKNITIVVAGKFSDSQIKKLIKQYFLYPNSAKKIKLKKFNKKQLKPRIHLLKKNTEQAHLALGFPAYHYGHKNLMAMSLLSVILGGNMSSRLFINIREKQGLCYFIKSIPNIYQDCGNLMIQAGLDKSRIKQAITLILEELEKIKNEGVEKDELKRAKDYLVGQMAIQLEDTENIANYFGRQEILLEKITSPQEKIRKIKKVTSSDVIKAAKDIIKKEKLNLAIIGPFSDAKIFQELIK